MTTNWGKQKKAIGRIRDEKKLIEILLSDLAHSGLSPDDQVHLRQLCIERINDQQFLAQFFMALTQEPPLEAFGWIVLKRLTDPSLLYALVRQHPSDSGKRAAVRHLSDVRVLTHIVANSALSADVRCATMERLGELKQSDWGEADQRLFAQIAMDASENGKLRALCGEQITDENMLCRLILSFADEKSMQKLWIKCIEDERIKNPTLLKQIALMDSYVSGGAANRIDPSDAQDVFIKTTVVDVETAAMKKMKANELMALFENLPKDSLKREHIATWIPVEYAPTCWWRKREAEYPQHSDIIMQRLAMCGSEDEAVRFVRQHIGDGINIRKLFEKRCSFALIELLEEMVSEGNWHASVQLRWLYSDAELPELFAQHADRQKKRFRDVHNDGPISSNCAGHSDYVDKDGLIEPL
jgi:hypothetical protein